ncbi:phosphotransferase [Epibacterium sp. MM17-32]|uniref:phosphotransferase n=1 Tax=Epibacterium sp. MM17-32 TaxID=2917734 RepID=UPI001EF5C7DD|nr:phosphotransferase [Epibacterium sp. MM17-32]MCG7630591.1 phosphotransferase [Epibacterium sp. MM17-32]
MVRILLVEDEEDFFEQVRDVCLDVDPQCEILWAKSRDSAYQLISDDLFDLTVLDQKIPTMDGALDAHVDHGRAVWDELHRIASGTPVLIHTALSADDIIKTIVRRTREQRIWGCDKKFPTVDHLRKEDFDKLPSLLSDYFQSIRGLMDIEHSVSDGSNLDEQEFRLIKIFVRRIGGVRCRITKLSGGLSGSAVYHVDVFDASGQKIQNAVLKIGSHEMVETEQGNLGLINRLPASASPRFLEVLNFGAKDTAAIAYQLADGYGQNAFSILSESPERLEEVLKGINNQRKPWVEGSIETRITVGDLRRTVLDDDTARQLFEEHSLNWAAGFEARELQVHWGCIHGDLHGENVLFCDEGGDPVFIDYGDVKEGPMALDWMTLESSILFHPGASVIGVEPGKRVNPKEWASNEKYSSLENVANYSALCRSFAESEGLHRRELVAATYAYVLCQLKYKDTDKELATSLLNAVHSAFDT